MHPLLAERLRREPFVDARINFASNQQSAISIQQSAISKIFEKLELIKLSNFFSRCGVNHQIFVDSNQQNQQSAINNQQSAGFLKSKN